jgi:hypothetical protein
MITSWFQENGGTSVTGFESLKRIFKTGIKAPKDTMENSIPMIFRIILMIA